MERSYSDPEYIEYLKNNIRHSKDIYTCINCFDTKERGVKKESIVRIPKRTIFYRECDNCTHGWDNKCHRCPTGDTLGTGDYEEIPLSHTCEFGRTDRYGRVVSMSELCCPVCHKPVHKIIGKNIIISIIGSRDSGKSHYIGVLLHEIMDRLAKQFEWTVVPEENTLRLYEIHFRSIYTSRQILNLTGKNYDGYYDPYIFYITDKRGKTFTLTIFDTAGEDFESDDLMENSAKHAFHATGIIFLVDPLKIAKVYAGLNQDVVTNSSSVPADRAFQSDVILSILSRSLRRHYRIRENKKIPIPLGVAVPKMDVIAADIPPSSACLHISSHVKRKGFVAAENQRVSAEIYRWLAGLKDGAMDSFMAQLGMNYSRYSYFGVSSLGMGNPPDKNGVFLTPRPHRVEDPVLWILRESKMIPKK